VKSEATEARWQQSLQAIAGFQLLFSIKMGVIGRFWAATLFFDSSSNWITLATQLRTNYSRARRRVGKPVRWLLQPFKWQMMVARSRVEAMKVVRNRILDVFWKWRKENFLTDWLYVGHERKRRVEIDFKLLSLCNWEGRNLPSFVYRDWITEGRAGLKKDRRFHLGHG